MAEETKVAVINLETGLVDNIAVVRDGDGSTAPAGFRFVPYDEAAIGDSWDGANIIPAPQPDVATPVEVAAGGMTSEPPDRAPSLQQQIDALSARLTALEGRASLSTSTMSTTGDLK